MIGIAPTVVKEIASGLFGYIVANHWRIIAAVPEAAAVDMDVPARDIECADRLLSVVIHT